ncbi:MarC family protein [Thermodesulfatator atlanticus]|uniref:MarC family protein n=1 Tax=Thermodesulfatator atlanticus TaxID=501497 RepID=UPI0003B71D5C|nr:NAAT family transporter [Thermodesulfatator atlanticus]
MEILKGFLHIFVPLFIIVDPIGCIPLFLGLTEKLPPERKKKVALKASVVAALVLTAFSLLGDRLLLYFDISVASFRVAGGLILLLIALQMIQAQPRATKSLPEEEEESRQKEDVAIVPLGVPILAGPGAITTILVFTAGEANFILRFKVIIAIFTVALISFLMFSNAARIAKMLGQTGTNLFVRIMGLILAVISVEYMARGLGELFPGLLSP